MTAYNHDETLARYVEHIEKVRSTVDKVAGSPMTHVLTNAVFDYMLSEARSDDARRKMEKRPPRDDMDFVLYPYLQLMLMLTTQMAGLGISMYEPERRPRALSSFFNSITMVHSVATEDTVNQLKRAAMNKIARGQ